MFTFELLRDRARPMLASGSDAKGMEKLMKPASAAKATKLRLAAIQSPFLVARRNACGSSEAIRRRLAKLAIGLEQAALPNPPRPASTHKPSATQRRNRISSRRVGSSVICAMMNASSSGMRRGMP